MIGKSVSAAAVLALAAFFVGPGANAMAQSTTAPAADAKATTAPAPVVVIASVEAFWTADQYARIGGYVSEVKADIGDRVTKGQVLAVIDAPEVQKDLAAARATLAARRESANAAEAVVRQAEAALAVAGKQLVGLEADLQLVETTLKRQEQLFETKAATGQQIDDARAKAAVSRAATDVSRAKIGAAEADVATAKANALVARAQVQVAQAEVEKIQTLVAYAQIVAPFDGVVTRRAANPGDLVSATGGRAAPLFTCQRVDTVRVYCSVPEASAAGVREGTPAEISFYGSGGQPLRGTVTRLAGSFDPSTRTMRAEIDLPNPNGLLRPGMYAQVTLMPSAK